MYKVDCNWWIVRIVFVTILMLESFNNKQKKVDTKHECINLWHLLDVVRFGKIFSQKFGTPTHLKMLYVILGCSLSLSWREHKCIANSNALPMCITIILRFCIYQISKSSIVHFHSVQFIKIHALNNILLNIQWYKP